MCTHSISNLFFLCSWNVLNVIQRLWIRANKMGCLFGYATLMLVMQKESSIRVIDPTLSRLPSSWMRKRIALQQKRKKAKIIIRLFANEHIRVRASARTPKATANLWICPLFEIISVGRMHFSLLYENYRFSRNEWHSFGKCWNMAADWWWKTW